MADDESASKAAAKVQEAAANIHQAATSSAERDHQAARPRRWRGATSRRSARATWTRRWRCGRDGGRENVRGQVDVTAPEGVREFIGEPDRSDAGHEDGGRRDHHRGRALRGAVALTGTFAGPGSLNGVAPTGDPVKLEGVDVLTVRDGLIQSNDAFPDAMALPRQIGLMPPQGSAAEQRLTGAFNVKTR